MNNWLISLDNSVGNFWLQFLIMAVFIIAFVMSSVIMFIWTERRVIARFQARLGPNRAGPFGLFQAIADTVKILTKEDIIPSLADRVLFWTAPAIAFIPTLMIMATIPFMNGFQMVDLNVGVLFISAVSAISAIGIFLSGVAGNNKYSLIGAMREIAQLISFEIPMVLSLASLVIACGSMSLTQIVAAQNVPNIILQPLGFVVFMVAILAEINRTPFDLVEADSELTCGFNTEYSGMKFALLYLTEYSEAVVGAALITTFFLGGWRGPFLPGIMWFVVKMIASFMFILWLRSTLPRLRIDQSMHLAWKGLLPLALVNLFVIALKNVFFPDLSLWISVPVYILVSVLVILLWAGFLRKGRKSLVV
ncbi:MAG: NADH-quinone oxidoreductase subunit NuoH [Dehalococcoidia bacterium]|nr:NADH-quinone oxidoreductase subunit NuoH [Dehalococcoidia bacterium]